MPDKFDQLKQAADSKIKGEEVAIRNWFSVHKWALIDGAVVGLALGILLGKHLP